MSAHRLRIAILRDGDIHLAVADIDAGGVGLDQRPLLGLRLRPTAAGTTSAWGMAPEILLE